MRLKMIMIVCISLIAIMSVGAISASEDIAGDNMTAIETTGEPIAQTVDDDGIISLDDEQEDVIAPDIIEPMEYYGTVVDEDTEEIYTNYVNIFSVGEKFNLGIDANEEVNGTFRVYYAGMNEAGLYKWNDTVLASADIIDGIGVVELSFPNTGLYSLYNATYLWIEYNTTKGNGHLEFDRLYIIENPKDINVSVSPLEFVEEGNNTVTVRFYSPVGGFLEIYRDGVDGYGTVKVLNETLVENYYSYTKNLDYFSVGNHTIRVFFEQYSSFYDSIYGPDLYKYSKTFNINVKPWEYTIVQTASKIVASAATFTYNTNSKYVKFTLTDEKGNPIAGEEVTVKFSGDKKTYKVFTNSQGKSSFDVNTKIVPDTYSATLTFAGDESYKASSRTVKVTIKKATPKMTAKAKSFKKSVKTKKYTVTLKDNQNKAIKSAKVTIKVNKKTYSAYTNYKGQATLKITKLTKKGKYTATVKYAGSKYFAAKSAKVKITVK